MIALGGFLEDAIYWLRSLNQDMDMCVPDEPCFRIGFADTPRRGRLNGISRDRNACGAIASGD